MSQPTAQEIKNAKENLSNMYELMDDLQLDFTDIMQNLIQLLSNPDQHDPGQGAMDAVISGVFDVFGIGASLAGLPAAGPIAALGSLIVKSIVNSPPPNLHTQFANYGDRFVKNIHDFQGILADYSTNVVTHWNTKITDPGNNKSYTLSVFGKASYVPSKTKNLAAYNKYRVQFRKAADVNTWKYFIPLIYTKGVRDDMHPGGPSSNYACHDCWHTKAGAIATFRSYIENNPASYFRILSFSGKCQSNAGTSTAYDYWTLGRGIYSYANKAVCDYLFIDDGFGKVLNPDALVKREEVFLHWGLKETFLPGATSYGANCQLIHAKTASAVEAELAEETPLSERGTISGDLLKGKDMPQLQLEDVLMDFADISDANLKEASLKKIAGEDILAQSIQLEKANVIGAKLPGADFRNAVLKNANLNNADLGGCDFRGADLQNVNLKGAFLRGADFREAKLNGIQLEGADITNTWGLDGFPSSSVVPERYRDRISFVPLNLKKITEEAQVLAGLTGGTLNAHYITNLLSALPSNFELSYNFELPLWSPASLVLSIVIRSSGPAGIKGVADMMEQHGVQKSEVEAFVQRCKTAFWPLTGLRVNFNTDRSISLEPFIDGPIGWPEVSILLSEESSSHQFALEKVTTLLDRQSIYLFGGSTDKTMEAIALRVFPKHVNHISKLCQEIGLNWEDNNDLAQLIKKSPLPVIVLGQSKNGDLQPELSIYIPTANKQMLALGLLEKETQKKLRELLKLQKTTAMQITALCFRINREGRKVLSYI